MIPILLRVTFNPIQKFERRYRWLGGSINQCCQLAVIAAFKQVAIILPYAILCKMLSNRSYCSTIAREFEQTAIFHDP